MSSRIRRRPITKRATSDRTFPVVFWMYELSIIALLPWDWKKKPVSYEDMIDKKPEYFEIHSFTYSRSKIINVLYKGVATFASNGKIKSIVVDGEEMKYIG